MYIPPAPGGLQPPSEEDRMPIWQVTNGDDLMLTTKLAMPGHPNTAATPLNSRVRFVLAEDRFDTRQIWVGEWNSGITPVDGHPGLVKIRIDDGTAIRLRRGSYAFSMQITDVFGKQRTTILRGTMLMEYEPNSDNHNIPYKLTTERPYEV